MPSQPLCNLSQTAWPYSVPSEPGNRITSYNVCYTKLLRDLEEHYTIDDDLDYIMDDELNDISYKQSHKHKHLFLYDDNDTSVLNSYNFV